MGLIGGIILGIGAGYIATKIMKEDSGILKNLILGVIGGFVGGLLFGILGFAATGLPGSLIVSTVGACICIWLGRKFL